MTKAGTGNNPAVNSFADPGGVTAEAAETRWTPVIAVP
jgi:hypothetical protein